MKLYDIIRKPLITEKSTTEKDAKGIVAFQVHVDANKHEIKEAVESLFKVKVENVNTAVLAGKVKRHGKQFGKRSNWKKAYVTLKEGSTIEFFEV